MICVSCVLLRWGTTGTWRAVNRSVSVLVEVRSAVKTPAVNQPLRAASFRTDSTNASLWVSPTLTSPLTCQSFTESFIFFTDNKSSNQLVLSSSGKGICSVSGDPHYTTFDKRTHHYMGACSYTLTKLCNSSSGLPDFSVATQNERRGSNTKVSYVRAVMVTVNDLTVILGKAHTVQVCHHPPWSVHPGHKRAPVLNLFLLSRSMGRQWFHLSAPFLELRST